MPLRGSDDDEVAHEKRRRPRAPLTLTFQHRHDPVEDFVTDVTADLGPGGAFVRTAEPLPEGTTFYFQLKPAHRPRLVEGLGRVVHTEPPGGEHPAGMGVTFLGLDAEILAMIEEIVAERLGHQAS